MRCLFWWLTSLAATFVTVTISFLWFDRPIATMVHNGLRHPHLAISERLTQIPDPFITLSVVVFIFLGLRALAGRTLSSHQGAAFLCSLSVITTETTKDQLKFIFGRTWPETWVNNNPSFIRDDIYGFNFMHGGAAYQSFPSGHMAAVCAAISVIWICYPRSRWICAIVGFTAGAGLVGTNYHFFSDIIAGAFVGVSMGWLATAIWLSSVQAETITRVSCDVPSDAINALNTGPRSS